VYQPTKIELASNPIWNKRVKQLERILDTPHTFEQLKRRSRISFGWSQPMLQNVLAMGELKQVYFADGKWRRM
jgi:hypothetical protein